MTENQVRLTIGALLHDVGKVIYRTGDGRNHSASGKDYLENEVGIKDNLVLESIAYHHGSNLKNAKIADDSYAYITYYADNIAASADRREKAEGEGGFDKKVPLASVFNILNGNSQNYHYSRQILDIENGINYPTEERVDLQEDFYKKIRQNLTDCLKQINYTEEYLNSLLAVLESNLSYIPSSTSKKEMEDISLYDHMKITAALAQCIEHYLVENQIKNYREKLMMKTEKLYDEKMFVLYSMDISGIQKFIYTINSEGALRSLRARSFYLEIMMEHIIDELLEQLSLSRANLIYSGGGHCYLLVPNTVQSKKIIQRKEEETNQWLLDTYGIALYVAGGYAECSANDLKNNPTGSYSELYRKVSRMISEKKSHRYGKKELIALNTQKTKGERECKVCRRIAAVSENGKCNICRNLEKMSGNILYENFFIVQSEIQEDALPLPGEKYLIADNEAGTKKRMETASYVRCYTKNRLFTGKRVATKLWVGDYTSQDTFEEFAQKAKGMTVVQSADGSVQINGTVRDYRKESDQYDDQYNPDPRVVYSFTASGKADEKSELGTVIEKVEVLELVSGTADSSPVQAGYTEIGNSQETIVEDQMTQDEKIQYIRDIYYPTQANLANYRIQEEAGIYRRYIDGNGKVVKMIVYASESEFPNCENPEDYVVEYFFDVNKGEHEELVFAFVQNEVTGDEYRFYQYNYELIRYIDSSNTVYDEVNESDISETPYTLYVNGNREVTMF